MYNNLQSLFLSLMKIHNSIHTYELCIEHVAKPQFKFLKDMTILDKWNNFLYSLQNLKFGINDIFGSIKIDGYVCTEDYLSDKIDHKQYYCSCDNCKKDLGILSIIDIVLTNGKCPFCQCILNKNASQNNIKYLGLNHNRITTLVSYKRSNDHKNRFLYYICLCGKVQIGQSRDIISEITKSCGCANRENTSIQRKKDFTGQRFGRLTVLREAGKDNFGQILWECECSCKDKNRIIVPGYRLFWGHTKSCGCLQKESSKSRDKSSITKHGLTGCRLYKTWDGMKARCFRTTDKNYKDYGGRGITICNEWLDKDNGFVNFYNWAIANGYEDYLFIDRIDNNGNYEPSNCRWVTMKQQARNKRNTIYAPNTNIPLVDFCKDNGLVYTTIKNRAIRLGISLEESINYYLNGKK